jgi:hypothetical protein
VKTNRLFVCLNSAVVIVAAMLYLSGVAMAQSPKERKPADKTPPPQQDTFSDDGTPTFEDTPSPTFQPQPIPAKHDDKEKEQKEKKEKKDKDDGVVAIQTALPDLKYISMVVTPAGDVAGGSGVTGQAATLTITIILITGRELRESFGWTHGNICPSRPTLVQLAIPARPLSRSLATLR